MHALIRVVIAFMIATSALGPKSARAEDTFNYSTVGSWTIGLDRTMGNGCFVLATFEGGSNFRLGFDMRDDPVGFYVIFGNVKWRSVEYGKTYRIQLRFGDEEAWEGDATGFSFDPPENQHWLIINFSAQNGLELANEFMRELFVVVHYNKKQILRLKLKNSYQAGLQLIECQKQANQAEGDPFKDASSPSDDDPFQ